MCCATGCAWSWRQGRHLRLRSVDPQNPPEDLIDLNPYHSVPTLVERELVLYAASVVSEYLTSAARIRR